MKKITDLTGQRFSRLEVIGRHGIDYKRNVLWLCKCSCGSEKDVILRKFSLESGKTKSCGCIAREILIKRNKDGIVRIKNEDFFDTINTEAKAYFLGFLYADGCVTYSEKGSRLRLHLKDDKDNLLLIERFLKEIGSPHKIKYQTTKRNFNNNGYKEYYGIHIEITNDKLCNDLIKHGCTPRKSLTLEFPTTVPENLIHHFIRGYFDGDGHVGFYLGKQKTCKFSICGTKEFLLSIQDILIKILGFTKTNLYKYKNVYTLDYGGPKNCNEFNRYLYFNSSIFLLRKRDIFENIFKNRNPLVKK